MTKNLEVYFDGSCGPNNPGGTAAYGFVVYDNDRKLVYSGYGRVVDGPGASNNVGEYEALYRAMRYIDTNHNDATVVFKGDSTLVINQMNGTAKARKGLYIPYYIKSMELARPFIREGLWSFEWIPRDMNSEADELSQYQRYKER